MRHFAFARPTLSVRPLVRNCPRIWASQAIREGNLDHALTALESCKVLCIGARMNLGE
jgi:hypothetical protein